MRKALIAIAIVSAIGLASSGLMAWGGPGRGGCSGCGQGYMPGGGFNGFRHFEFLEKEIGLSEDQLEKIIRINSDFRLKYFNNRKDSDKLNELREEHRN